MKSFISSAEKLSGTSSEGELTGRGRMEICDGIISMREEEKAKQAVALCVRDRFLRSRPEQYLHEEQEEEELEARVT